MSMIDRLKAYEKDRLEPENFQLQPEVEVQTFPEAGKIPNWIIACDKVYTDDRLDMPDDAIFWLQLYVSADALNPDLYKNLRIMRNHGTQIVAGKNGYVIRPVIREGAWRSQGEYNRHRDKLIAPHRDTITRMLKNLFKWED